jgi:hypothetical protein
MGAPDTSVCQCSLAMDEWKKLHIAPIQTMLGLIINTNRMTVSVPDNCIQDVCLLIDSTWHTHHQQFTVKEAQELTGKLGPLAEGANWVFYLLTHLYASIAYALSEKKDSWQILLQSFKPSSSHHGLATFSAMSRTKSATSLLPSNGLQNWYINPGVSTTSPSQCAR